MLLTVNKVKFLIFLVNVAAVGYLVYVVGAGNDKSIVLMLFYYPVLILANGLMACGVRKRNRQVAGYFYWAALLLIILFLPLLLITPWFTF
jgi:hypothetical protein